MTPLLRFLLDENLRGVLWRAIQRHNSFGVYPIDAVRVGDPPDLPMGSFDPDILLWAERQGRILVSMDKKTLGGHLAQHLQVRHYSPGILIVKRSIGVPKVLEYLVHAAYAAHPLEYQDSVTSMA